MHFEPSIQLHRPAPGRLVFIFALAGLLLAIGARSAAAQPAAALRFTSEFRWFDSGRLAHDLVHADFNGDGLGDLALSHPDDDGISILLGAPGGGFRSRVGFAAGPDPRDLAALDADGDGRLDLVVANCRAGTVSILRGAGNGTFAPPRAFGVGADPAGALAGDLDGDGILDLVLIVGAGRNTALFLRGRGDFAYDAPTTIREGAGPLQLVVVRLPGVRHEGLAVADADGRIEVLAVTPSGHFHRVDEVSIGAVPAGLAAADVDRDGHVDLVVSVGAGSVVEAEEQGGVRILRGTASGKFGPALAFDADFVPAALTVGDVDLDGWPDVLSVDRRGGGIGVFRNDRSGRLLGSPPHAARLGAGKFAVDDWNCDGRPDLVGLEPGGRGAVLLAGRGDGSFGEATALRLDFGPADLWLGDLDGDGRLDVAAPDRFADGLTVLRGDGAGGFAESGRVTYPVGFSPTRVHGARLLAAGAIDLVVAHATYRGFLSVARNPGGKGALTFAPDDTVDVGGRPVALVVGQVDAGGGEDVIVAIAGTSTVAVLLADGAGRLRLHATLETGVGGLAALALGDVDGDTRTDLVVAAEGAHSISVWKGSGGGDFTRGQEWRTGLRPLALALADLDGDGDLDVVSGQGAAYPAGGLVVVYPGDGNGGFGGFATAATARVGAEPRGLAVANFDGVGGLDLAVANAGASTLTILPGGAAGTLSFGAPLTLGTAAAADALAAGDLDGDGRIDLVSAGLVSDRIGVLLNRTGDPTESAPGVTLDVMPGACPNVLDPAANGLLRVALVSAGAFDFADLIVSSVRLAGVRAGHATLTLRDESGPVDACGSGCPCDGRTPDGVLDAVFEFDAQAVAAGLVAAPAGATTAVKFEARLRGGRVIEVADCVILPGGGARLPGTDATVFAAAGVVTPNPMPRGGTMEYAYEIPTGGAAIEIALYTVAGRRMATLAHGPAAAGEHAVTWAARDDAGRPFAAGVYYLRVTVAGARTTARVVVLP